MSGASFFRSRRIRECDKCGAHRPEFHLRRAALTSNTARVVGTLWLCGPCWTVTAGSQATGSVLLDVVPIRRMLVRKGRIREVP